jgi:arylsulfatase
MITRLDQEVGRLVECVRELGLEQQTVIVFTSDNGPLYDRVGGTDTDFFDSASGLRGRKGSLYEGGVRVPCIVRWPGHISAGTTNDRVTGFEDWLATLLELAGLKSDIPKGLDGISFAPTLLGRRQRERPFLYREFSGYGGQQSIRVGDWKAVRQGLLPRGANPRLPDLHIQLYELKEDPTEARDVATQHPRRVARLEQLMRRERRVSALFPLPALDKLASRQ